MEYLNIEEATKQWYFLDCLVRRLRQTKKMTDVTCVHYTVSIFKKVVNLFDKKRVCRKMNSCKYAPTQIRIDLLDAKILYQATHRTLSKAVEYLYVLGFIAGCVGYQSLIIDRVNGEIHCLSLLNKLDNNNNYPRLPVMIWRLYHKPLLFHDVPTQKGRLAEGLKRTKRYSVGNIALLYLCYESISLIENRMDCTEFRKSDKKILGF